MKKGKKNKENFTYTTCLKFIDGKSEIASFELVKFEITLVIENGIFSVDTPLPRKS